MAMNNLETDFLGNSGTDKRLAVLRFEHETGARHRSPRRFGQHKREPLRPGGVVLGRPLSDGRGMTRGGLALRNLQTFAEVLSAQYQCTARQRTGKKDH